ncbi:MAG: flagellar basal body-associated FliL family protein [Burkholderiaceae bacterium]|nr:flagellar basal body-associated FliL family protein [Burkholderiaceae bacterium]
MSATPNAANNNAPAPAPAKGKKLIVLIAIIAVLAIAAAAAYVLLAQRHSGNPDEEEGASKAAVSVPTFLPLDSLVVNLADPGGDRFVQIGITLELADEKTATMVKQYLPSIRNGILMLVSQRTAEELLERDGKERLAADVLGEVSAPLGYGNQKAKKRSRDEDADEEDGERRRTAKSPVRRVLFSSFIIQ